MTGNTDDINNPAKFFQEKNQFKYPSCFNFSGSEKTVLPSINSKRLYIPINIWFTLMSKMAFPLVSLQYNELQIDFKLRAVNDLYVIRDINNPNFNDYNETPYIRNFSDNLYKFLQPPPSHNININSNFSSLYPNTFNSWNENIHILATYGFLDNDEVQVFTSKPQQYLIKEFREYNFYELVGANTLEIETNGLVCNFMFYFQRNDIKECNEWSNYSNWKYDNIIPEYPQRLKTDFMKNGGNYNVLFNNLNFQEEENIYYNPLSSNYIYFTKNYDISNNVNYKLINQKNIMNEFGILLDGKYRENIFDQGVYNYVDYYIRSSGKGKEGLYFYNFGLNTNPYSMQPNGAINLAKFNRVEFQTNLISPPLNNSAQVKIICDEDDIVLGIEKTPNNLYEYTFNLTVQEERYNMLQFINGNAQLMFA